MVTDVDALNAARETEVQEQGRAYQPIEIGIGINTGTCTVGNMGSDMRFDYTAMGDPVNLASRLEGQSRNYGTPIIIGSSTEAAVRADFAILELDLIRVKGKSQPERVFALLGDAEMRNDVRFVQIALLNARLVAAYRGRRWEEALSTIDELEPMAVRIQPRLTVHFDNLRDRIEVLRTFPPPDTWDGVFDATSK